MGKARESLVDGSEVGINIVELIHPVQIFYTNSKDPVQNPLRKLMMAEEKYSCLSRISLSFLSEFTRFP